MAAVADSSNDRMKTALIAGAGVAAVAGAAYYASKYLFGKKTCEVSAQCERRDARRS
jgi:hypothetical protein